jgi:hypothetical protein
MKYSHFQRHTKTENEVNTFNLILHFPAQSNYIKCMKFIQCPQLSTDII